VTGLPAGWLRVVVTAVPPAGTVPSPPTRTEWFRA
jgi:hypothetical protein